MLDLGWLAATWPDAAEKITRVAVTPWDSFSNLNEIVSRHLDQTGRDQFDARWYTVLAPFKLGVILEGAHARACAGLAPKPIGDQLHQHASEQFERALRRIRQPIV